jgi:hypothetical protein
MMTEDACIEYFFRMKWPDGFHCPRCAYPRYYVIRSRRLPLYQCYACHHQTSLTAGTIMERSRTSLQKWMETFRLFSESAGVNAVQLSHHIRVTYKTAWSMLRSIRQAISDLYAGKVLSGPSIAGYGFYGRPNYHFYVRHPQEHPIMVGAAFHPDGEPVELKLQVIPLDHMDGKIIRRYREASLLDGLIRPSAQDGSRLKRIRFCDTTGLYELFGQAKKWLNRTFHGIGPRYLQTYWDEYCFRFRMTRHFRPLQDTLTSLCLTSDFDDEF